MTRRERKQAISDLFTGKEMRLRDITLAFEDAAFVARFGEDPDDAEVACALCGKPFVEHRPSGCDAYLAKSLDEAERLLRAGLMNNEGTASPVMNKQDWLNQVRAFLEQSHDA